MQMYDELRTRGVESLELPTQNVVLVGAFSQKTHRVKKQVFMSLNFGGLEIDQIFLVSEQLMTPILIGCDFCIANGLIIDFQKETVSMKRSEQSIEVDFMNNQEEERGGETSVAALRNRQAIALPTPQSDPSPLTTSETHSQKPVPCENEPSVPNPNELCKGNGENNSYFRGLPNCTAGNEENYGNTDYGSEIVKTPFGGCKFFEGRNKGHVAHRVGSEGDVCVLSITAKGEVTGDIQKRYYDTVKNARKQGTKPDDRAPKSESVLRDVNVEEGVQGHQRNRLLTLLLEYQDHFSKKPGKCNCFEYNFQVQGGVPNSRNSRPIPFALHKEVQAQIEEMLADHIIEESYSSYVNPITLVQK